MSEREAAPQPEKNQGISIPKTYALTPDTEEHPYTPREQDRLRVYSKLLDKSRVTKQRLENGQEFVFGTPNHNGDIPNPLGIMDAAFASTWEKRANTLFYDEFLGKEHMIQAAVTIQSQLDEKYAPAPVDSENQPPDIQTLKDLWEREY